MKTAVIVDAVCTSCGKRNGRIDPCVVLKNFSPLKPLANSYPRASRVLLS